MDNEILFEKEQQMSERVCPWWLADWLTSPLRRLIQNPERILTGLISPGQTVVDLGCGPGFFTVAMAKMVGDSGRVIAVDLQTEMLDMARRNAERAGLNRAFAFTKASLTALESSSRRILRSLSGWFTKCQMPRGFWGKSGHF
jgi:ubiquinone/menaquinone biosynthesis C-methylase UbiE